MKWLSQHAKTLVSPRRKEQTQKSREDVTTVATGGTENNGAENG